MHLAEIAEMKSISKPPLQMEIYTYQEILSTHDFRKEAVTWLESGCKVKSFPSRTFLLQAMAFKGEEKKTGEGGKLAWFPEEPGLILHRTPGNFSPGASADVKKSHFHPHPVPPPSMGREFLFVFCAVIFSGRGYGRDS